MQTTEGVPLHDLLRFGTVSLSKLTFFRRSCQRSPRSDGDENDTILFTLTCADLKLVSKLKAAQ